MLVVALEFRLPVDDGDGDGGERGDDTRNQSRWPFEMEAASGF